MTVSASLTEGSFFFQRTIGWEVVPSEKIVSLLHLNIFGWSKYPAEENAIVHLL